MLQTARRDIPAGLFEDLPSLEEVERRYLEHVLQAVRRNRTRAADVLGIDRRTLYRMAERYGIKLGDDREDLGPKTAVPRRECRRLNPWTGAPPRQPTINGPARRVWLKCDGAHVLVELGRSLIHPRNLAPINFSGETPAFGSHPLGKCGRHPLRVALRSSRAAV